MWIVLLSNNTRHSAWTTKQGALHQQSVLKNAGYPVIYVRYDPTTQCENGYYYV